MKVRCNLPVSVVIVALAAGAAPKCIANFCQRVDIAFRKDKAFTFEGCVTEEGVAALGIKVAPELVFYNGVRVTEAGVLADDERRDKQGRQCDQNNVFSFHRPFIPLSA